MIREKEFGGYTKAGLMTWATDAWEQGSRARAENPNVRIFAQIKILTRPKEARPAKKNTNTAQARLPAGPEAGYVFFSRGGRLGDVYVFFFSRPGTCMYFFSRSRLAGRRVCIFSLRAWDVLGFFALGEKGTHFASFNKGFGRKIGLLHGHMLAGWGRVSIFLWRAVYVFFSRPAGWGTCMYFLRGRGRVCIFFRGLPWTCMYFYFTNPACAGRVSIFQILK